MTDNYTDDKIFSIIQDIIVEALRIDPSKVEPNARFFIDLGAESIDVLDIRFRPIAMQLPGQYRVCHRSPGLLSFPSSTPSLFLQAVPLHTQEGFPP